MKPWEPQKGESMPAYQAFAEYRDMGDSRSLEAVRLKVGKSSRLIARWSSRWSWVERVRQYAMHMEGIEQRGREKALGNQAEDWAARQIRIADALIEKSEKMLAFPLATQKSQDGRTIVEPARWSFGDAAKLSDTGIKLGRLARGESTDNVTVDDKRQKLAEVLGIPVEQMPIDETDRAAS